MTSKSGNRYSPELRERAVRMVLEQRGEYATIREAIHSIVPKIGCCTDTLRVWVKRHQQGLINTSISNNASPLTSDERQRLQELERENRELRRSNDILVIKPCATKIKSWPTLANITVCKKALIPVPCHSVNPTDGVNSGKCYL